VVLPLRVQGMWQRGFGGPLGGLRVLNLSGNAALGASRGNLSDQISRRNLAPYDTYLRLHPLEGRLFCGAACLLRFRLFLFWACLVVCDTGDAGLALLADVLASCGDSNGGRKVPEIKHSSGGGGNGLRTLRVLHFSGTGCGAFVSLWEKTEID
jgi:hypothetical protein